jgi:hypothetical protein
LLLLLLLLEMVLLLLLVVHGMFGGMLLHGSQLHLLWRVVERWRLNWH